MGPILVTGGAGFIGSAVVRRLVGERGAAVVTADCLTYAGNLDSLRPFMADPRHAFERVDIADRAALRAVFERHRPGAVLHLAAESHVDRSIDAPADFVRTNLLGTFNLLEESRRHWGGLSGEERERFRFLHVSTDEVHGSADTGARFHEGSAHRPSSPYAATKAGSDDLVRAWHHTWGLPVLLTTGSNTYGPYQFPEKLIPLALLNALAGEPVAVYGAGEHVRDWLYLDDHVDALLRVLDAGVPGESYAVGGGAELPNLELVRRLCRLLDDVAPDGAGPHERLIRLVPDRPGHDLRYGLDTSRMRDALGWAPRETLDSGLRRTVTWYLENRWWWERVRSGAYRGQRLGLGGELPAAGDRAP